MNFTTTLGSRIREREEDRPAEAIHRTQLFLDNILKLLNKDPAVAFLSNSAAGVIFCTGNDLKTLALCAARSHIVAVR